MRGLPVENAIEFANGPCCCPEHIPAEKEQVSETIDQDQLVLDSQLIEVDSDISIDAPKQVVHRLDAEAVSRNYNRNT